MIKRAGLEETTVTDPETGRKVRVSTTTRKVYRHIYKGQEQEMLRNVRLNELIANDFARSSGKVVHHFKIGKGEDKSLAEIRNSSGTVMFFISVERGEYIDILTLQNAWKSPKYTAQYGIIKNKER